MGLLSGGAATLLGRIFSKIYLPARVYSAVTVYDDHGEPTTSTTPRDCLAQVDAMTERQRAQEGAAEQDRRILVLSESLTGDIDTDCEIEVLEGPYAGQRYTVADVGRDTVGAYYELRGRRAG
jgi:hypothetical protein